MQDAQVINKQTSVDIPPGCLAILLSLKESNEDTSDVAVQMFHNFATSESLTKDERVLYAISQGILAMCIHEPMKVIYRGIEVIRNIFNSNDADFNEAGFEDFDVANLTPRGHA